MVCSTVPPRRRTPLAAGDAAARLGLNGEVPPASYPRVVAAAQARGSISLTHARIITATIDALPAAVHAEHHESVEEFSVEQA